MALPILAFLARMGLKHGGSKAIQMAVKKFGKKAVQKASTKMSYTGKSAAEKTAKKIFAKKIPKVKTYRDTKAHKETLKIRKRLGMTDKKNVIRGRKISTDFGKKAVEYSPPFMLRNLVREALGKNPTKKAVRKFFKDAYKPIRDKKMPERTRKMIENWKFKKKT
tara:strand:- start:305 stop:799 length:495 start_codon:yes stop_codon:yes gene_type:complete